MDRNLTNACKDCGKIFSLESLCLDLILEKFELFYFAFTVSKDEKIQRNFDFLQRRFSVQLITALFSSEILEEKYFELLINEHLDFLDGGWLYNSQYLNSMESIFRRIPNLKRICFSNCGDEVLENIAKFCPNIIEIDVSNTRVTDNGVKQLCQVKNGVVPCPNLKNVFIEDSNVTDSGAECLIRNLRSLEKFDYRDLPLLLHSIHKEDLSETGNANIYNLVEINLSGFQNLPYFTDILKTCLTVCPNLESISVCVTEKEQLNLFKNSRLKKLDLSVRNMNSKINIDNFLKMNEWNLTSLKIKECEISLSVLAGQCPVLKELEVNDVRFTMEVNDVQVLFPCLVKCCFEETRPPAAKAFNLLLSSSPKLENVSFQFGRLSLEMKNQLLVWCKNPSSKYIEFHHLRLEMKFIRDILISCPSLVAMCLNNCVFDISITEKFLNSLSKRLPNKPYVYIINFANMFPGMPMVDYTAFEYESAFHLKMYPEVKYESSSFYETLFRDMADKWKDYDSDEED